LYGVKEYTTEKLFGITVHNSNLFKIDLESTNFSIYQMWFFFFALSCWLKLNTVFELSFPEYLNPSTPAKKVNLDKVCFPKRAPIYVNSLKYVLNLKAGLSFVG